MGNNVKGANNYNSTKRNSLAERRSKERDNSLDSNNFNFSREFKNNSYFNSYTDFIDGDRNVLNDEYIGDSRTENNLFKNNIEENKIRNHKTIDYCYSLKHKKQNKNDQDLKKFDDLSSSNFMSNVNDHNSNFDSGGNPNKMNKNYSNSKFNCNRINYSNSVRKTCTFLSSPLNKRNDYFTEKNDLNARRITLNFNENIPPKNHINISNLDLKYFNDETLNKCPMDHNFDIKKSEKIIDINNLNHKNDNSWKNQFENMNMNRKNQNNILDLKSIIQKSVENVNDTNRRFSQLKNKNYNISSEFLKSYNNYNTNNNFNKNRRINIFEVDINNKSKLDDFKIYRQSQEIEDNRIQCHSVDTKNKIQLLGLNIKMNQKSNSNLLFNEENREGLSFQNFKNSNKQIDNFNNSSESKPKNDKFIEHINNNFENSLNKSNLCTYDLNSNYNNEKPQNYSEDKKINDLNNKITKNLGLNNFKNEDNMNNLNSSANNSLLTEFFENNCVNINNYEEKDNQLSLYTKNNVYNLQNIGDEKISPLNITKNKIQENKELKLDLNEIRKIGTISNGKNVFNDNTSIIFSDKSLIKNYNLESSQINNNTINEKDNNYVINRGSFNLFNNFDKDNLHDNFNSNKLLEDNTMSLNINAIINNTPKSLNKNFDTIKEKDTKNYNPFYDKKKQISNDQNMLVFSKTPKNFETNDSFANIKNGNIACFLGNFLANADKNLKIGGEYGYIEFNNSKKINNEKNYEIKNTQEEKNINNSQKKLGIENISSAINNNQNIKHDSNNFVFKNINNNTQSNFIFKIYFI